MKIHSRRRVQHVAEWLAFLLFKPQWGEKWPRVFRRRLAHKADSSGIRKVEFDL